MKTVCITGITGQTGAIAAEMLLERGDKVHGMIRRNSNFNTQRIDHIYNHPNLKLHYGDLSDYGSIVTLVSDIKPDWFANYGAQSVTEESILPILSSDKLNHWTFKQLWNSLSKNNEIKIENVDGVDVEVINLPHNLQVRALGYWNGMGNFYPIRQISRHRYNGKIVNMRQKFGEINVTPNHCIFDVNAAIRSPEENPWLLNVRKINYTNTSKIPRIIIPNKNSKNAEEFVLIDKNNINNFCEFVAAWVAEGNACYDSANNSYHVTISNQNKSWLEDLQKRLNSFYLGTSCFTRSKKESYEDVWNLQIRSYDLYKWLRKHCGKNSHTKKLPAFIFKLSPDIQKIFFTKLVEGDGCYEERKIVSDIWRYTTASYKLACQLSLLASLLRYDYTINIEDGKNEHFGKFYYHFRECIIYQPNQGDFGKKIKHVDYDGYVYDISLPGEKFCIGLGNIVVHNSFVKASFDIPEYTFDIDATGVIRCLEAIRKFSPNTKFLQCSTSELFGSSPAPQNEQTPFHPRSPYGAAKIAAYWATVNYREAYNLFACNAISYNHESPKRTGHFVTRKITMAACRIKAGLQNKLVLGNLHSLRDWIHAKDVARGHILMLEHDVPDDFVLASGVARTVQDFVEVVFSKLDLDWKECVEVSEKYFRPSEVDHLCGDYTKAKNTLGWEPQISFEMLVDEMIEEDMKLAEKEKLLQG